MNSIIFLLLIIIIIIFLRREKFICNVPFRTSSKCFSDKYNTCLSEIGDKYYCQDLANLECTVPPTVSGHFNGKIRCL